MWYGGQAEKAKTVVLPFLLPLPLIKLQWLEVPVTFGTIKTDIEDLAESRSNSGGVEVAGSNPVSPTAESSGKLMFPWGFSSFLALLAELPYPRELS